MIALAELDLLARGGTVALLLLWSWLLLRDHRDTLAARVAVAMNVAIMGYAVAWRFWVAAPFSLAAMIVDALSVMAPALFWLFAHIWFTDARRIGVRNWLIVGGFALLPVAQIIHIRITGEFWPLAWLLVRIGMIGFGVAGMWIAWRGRDNDLVEPRRRFRSAIVWIIGALVIWVSLIEIPVHGGFWNQMIRTLTQVAIALVTLVTTAAIYRFAQPQLFAAVAPPHSADDHVADRSALAIRLQTHMDAQRAYRTDGLTIAGLAAQLGEQEYRLRRLINGELGHRNFSAFLNGYRLAEVKSALTDPAQREVPILTIALDAGFGSLGPFNRAFREAEGMTPTAYRTAALIDSKID